MVARSLVRLFQASATRRLAGTGLVQPTAGRRVVVLPASDADAGAYAVDRVAGISGLPRRREAPRRPRTPNASAVLQFPCAEVQRKPRADAGLGGDLVLVSAFVPDAQRTLCSARRYWRRRLHARQILVGLSHRRFDRRGFVRSVARLFNAVH